MTAPRFVPEGRRRPAGVTPVFFQVPADMTDEQRERFAADVAAGLLGTTPDNDTEEGIVNKPMLTREELLAEAERMHQAAAPDTDADRAYGGFTAEMGDAIAATARAQAMGPDDLAPSYADYIAGESA